MFRKRWLLLSLASLLLLGPALRVAMPSPLATPRNPAQTQPIKLDLAEVRRKIATIALRDETLSFDEWPDTWLGARKERILPQLIGALDDKNADVAKACLRLLADMPANKALTDALVAKASDAHSPLRHNALCALEKSAADPRVAHLLDQASIETPNIAHSLTMARWAWLAGRQDRALAILKQLLNKGSDQTNAAEAIKLLGEIGGSASIARLDEIATGDRWALAAGARLALAKLDPRGHALTKDQETFLKGWQNLEQADRTGRWQIPDAAKLNVKELHPFVMQMLGDADNKAQDPSLEIAMAWKDKEAIPRIRPLLHNDRGHIRQAAVAAFLSIDEGPLAEAEILTLYQELTGSTKDRSRDAYLVLRGIATATIPMDHKVTLLRTAGANVEDPAVVAWALYDERDGYHENRMLLLPLMEKESDLEPLAAYCTIAARIRNELCVPHVRRAMVLLMSGPQEFDEGSRMATVGAEILDAVAAYNLNECAPDIQKLMHVQDPAMRHAALAAAAKFGILATTKELCAELGAQDAETRKAAANALMGAKSADEAARALREKTVLSFLGKPGEDYALRVLATCGREMTVKALLPILDEPNTQRAVYAAWVLAQLPDEKTAAKALRRVAICGILHGQRYQGGEGIDFDIAPNLEFHQVTEDLNPGRFPQEEAPVRIPENLLQPFTWDDAEQQYALRCYQCAVITGSLDGSVSGIGFQNFLGAEGEIQTGLNRTHLPLLREIAAHDPHLDQLMVQGKTVADFKYRRLAAQAIATVTKGNAIYIGLAGEKLTHNAFPQPYPDQDQLLARFIIDHVSKARHVNSFNDDRRMEYLSRSISEICSLFGEKPPGADEEVGQSTFNAVRQEARRQKVNLERILPSP